MNNNLPILFIPANAHRVPDSKGWKNSIGVPSESSDTLYVVAQREKKDGSVGGWGCSCFGWRRFRHCKHLKSMNLPAGETPYEVQLPKND